MIRRALTLAALLLALPATAQTEPLPPPPGSVRVQTIDYVEDRVIYVQGTPGYQTTIEFGGDERIETVSVGDSTAWQVTANKRGDHLFVKALSSGVASNMVVVTDRRLYTFDLTPLSGPVSEMAYAIRFRYAPAAESATEAGAAQATVGRYRVHGDRALRPDAISDDGTHTYIEWPASATLPAIYAIDGDGKEIVATGAMRDGVYVVDSVASRLIFRRDRNTAYADRLRPKDR
ncbi:hypothetical protein ASE86_14575 [Sphingomonas sp. Leaf33]|uniref:TrbG/VirB9 family P-type conjugative transfer protein n=1 Tax=Sphingomonas sp. Leaf33 TaxID=1736215 RepID=UPI0006FC19AF|nr:TrbG/VirB9 family P-type conjugative transfer protein [Sphingomonas sp. Leaf33]KQN21199.1 hypothetical protein ASE86_14575 [Sphingomonas sp. Leaf33]